MIGLYRFLWSVIRINRNLLVPSVTTKRWKDFGLSKRIRTFMQSRHRVQVALRVFVYLWVMDTKSFVSVRFRRKYDRDAHSELLSSINSNSNIRSVSFLKSTLFRFFFFTELGRSVLHHRSCWFDVGLSRPSQSILSQICAYGANVEKRRSQSSAWSVPIWMQSCQSIFAWSSATTSWRHWMRRFFALLPLCLLIFSTVPLSISSLWLSSDFLM